MGKLVPEGESFDYVFDNYAKDVATCEDLAAFAKAWYVPGFMVSAGGGETMMARDTLICCCKMSLGPMIGGRRNAHTN